MERLIWQYWEGPCPDYISLCLETVQKNAGVPVRLLGRADFDELLRPHHDIDFGRLTPVQRSDIIRAIALKDNGGLYIDADCIVLRPLDPIFAIAERVGNCVVHQEDGEIQTNFMCARPASQIATALVDGILQNVRSGRPLAWLDLATVPLVDAVARFPGEMSFLPTELVAPIHWSEPERFVVQASDAEHAGAANQNALCYMLSNDTMKSRGDVHFVTGLPRDALLDGRYFLSYLFRSALAG